MNYQVVKLLALPRVKQSQVMESISSLSTLSSTSLSSSFQLGKTFSMMGSKPDAPAQAIVNAGLYVLAARDIFKIVKLTSFQHLKIYVSCFEIYGGKYMYSIMCVFMSDYDDDNNDNDDDDDDNNNNVDDNVIKLMIMMTMMI